MLTENDVIDAVVSYLKGKGWNIDAISRTNQRGIDILAKKGRSSLAIEAKGGTSNRRGSSRYGKPFTTSQKLDHVSCALYTAVSVVSDGKHRAGIALPSDAKHMDLITRIKPALKALKMIVFLVDDDRTVREIK